MAETAENEQSKVEVISTNQDTARSIYEKLTSRKFWFALAAMLASIGSSIAGFATDNQTLITVGVICTMTSAAIYAFAEAYVDGKSVASNMTYKQISATATDKVTVQAVLGTAAVEQASTDVQSKTTSK